MARMTWSDWRAYAVLRNHIGKQQAEDFRHTRNRHHRDHGTGNYPRQSDWITVNWDVAEDGYTQKRFLPYHLSDAGKLAFENAHWISIGSPYYDCTGLPFTRRITFHEIPAGTWVYHSVGIDI